MKFDTLPRQCLVDEMLQIRVLGLRAGERLNLKLWSCFSDVVWRSEAVFLADSYGVVDLSTQAPVSGSYTGVDPRRMARLYPPTQGRIPRGAVGGEWRLSANLANTLIFKTMRLAFALFAYFATISSSGAAPATQTLEDCWNGNDHRGMSLCVNQRAASVRSKLDAAEAAMRNAIEKKKEPAAYILLVKKNFEASVKSYRHHRAKQCQLREALAAMGNGPDENRLACEAELDADRIEQLKADQWWLD